MIDVKNYLEEKISSKICNIYTALYNRYGELHWWPAESPYEVMVGAVLTQNTSWNNVEKAIQNFDGKLTPQFIEDIPIQELVELIRPSGFFNQKSLYLKELTKWFKTYSYNIENVALNPIEVLRKELISIKGVGPETADSIILYAVNLPTFVIDTYTRRLLDRIGIIDDKQDYNGIKALFEDNIEENLYNNYHALIVANAKDHCKKIPNCNDCPLADECNACTVRI